MTSDRVKEMLHKYSEDFAEFSDAEKRQQYRTKVKSIESYGGTTHVRNILEVAHKRMTEMLDENHPSPVPADDVSAILLRESMSVIESTVKKLKKVKDRPNRKK